MNTGAWSLRGPGEDRPARPQTPAQQDRIEISPQSQRRLDAEAALENRIAELRAQIAEGTYLTPEKIEYVVDRLYEEIMRGSRQNG